MTNGELLQNQRAAENAIAQQRLEGLAVSPEGMADMDRLVRGEITVDEALRATLARYTHDQIQ